jgi:flagellar motor switch protein FliG
MSAVSQHVEARAAQTGLTVSNTEKYRELAGAERAAVLLLALGEEYGRDIWKRLDELEVRQISLAMARLGPVTPEMLENLFVDFVTRLSSKGSLTGNYDSTERILASFLPPERVNHLMEEIRGPAGRNMWEKLSNVQENVLANYLKNEYPQTVALVLSKIRSDHAGRVLAILPDEFALEVVNRMLRMEAVQKDVLDKVEQTLRIEFMSNLSHTSRRDAHELMAEIFNSFDRQTEARFLTALEEDNREAAERIKSLMFTFEDLGKLDAAAIQTLLRNVEKDQLCIALKGASETVRNYFFSNMSSRAANMMKEDMEALGPVRLKDVDDAQSTMVNVAKDLAAKGDIVINKQKSEDELVY